MKKILSLSSTSISNNLKDDYDNLDDYFENISEKDKDETLYKDLSSNINDNIIEKSKDERFAKVYI
jgi:hypothetical protein